MAGEAQAINNSIEQIETERIEIIHINLHNAYAASQSISDYVEARSCVIASLNEPRSNNQSVYSIKVFDEIMSHQSEDPKEEIKAAIGVKNVDSNIIFGHLCNSKIAVSEISKNSLKLTFISAYFPPSEDINIGLNNLSEVLKELKNLGKNNPILICADTNARSVLWKDTETNQRGEFLEMFLAEENLNIINANGDITFQNSRGQSVIDLLICDEKFMELEYNFCIKNDETFNSNSDHFLCQIFVQTVNSNPGFQINSNSTRKYIINEEDFTKFEEAIEKYSSILEETDFDVISEYEADIVVDNLEKFFEETMDYSFKRIKARRKPNMVYNKEVKRLAQITNNKYKRWKRLSNTNAFLAEEALGEFNSAKSNLKSAILKHKTEHWREFCSKQELNHAYKLNKIIKLSVNKKPFSTIMREDGTFTNSVQDTLQTMIDSFYPDKNHPAISYESRPGINERIRPDVTLKELKDIIGRFSNKKAPGIDGITADVLKKLPDHILERLVIFYRSLLKIGYFPKKWKIGVVVPIPKPTKNRIRTVKDQRGITLLVLLGKIEEILMVNRLDLHDYSNNLINENQFGFTKQRSTVDALHNLRNFIQDGINIRKSTAIISFDIKGAFDNACWKKIIDTLVENETPDYLIRTAKSFFEDRTVIMRQGNVEIQKGVKQGCPQGSCSGPKFWNTLFNNLFKKLKETDELDETTLSQAFADDKIIAIHYEESEEGVRQVENRANLIVQIITEWGRDFHLEFNPNKTHFIRISKQAMHRTPVIRVGDRTLDNSATLKYLGVTFDQEFDFKKHVECVATKAKKAFFLLKRFSANTWGINSEIGTLVFKTIVRPIIAYASAIWYPALVAANSRKVLRSVQHFCGINIVKGWRTISIVSALTLSNLLPIEKYILVIAQSDLSRISGKIHPKILNESLFKEASPKIQFSHKSVHETFKQKRLLENENELNASQLEDFRTDNSELIEPVISWATMYNLETIEKLADEDESYKADLYIYTDGAKPAIGAGSAFVILRRNNSELGKE